MKKGILVLVLIFMLASCKSYNVIDDPNVTPSESNTILDALQILRLITSQITPSNEMKEVEKILPKSELNTVSTGLGAIQVLDTQKWQKHLLYVQIHGVMLQKNLTELIALSQDKTVEFAVESTRSLDEIMASPYSKKDQMILKSLDASISLFTLILSATDSTSPSVRAEAKAALKEDVLKLFTQEVINVLLEEINSKLKSEGKLSDDILLNMAKLGIESSLKSLMDYVLMNVINKLDLIKRINIDINESIAKIPVPMETLLENLTNNIDLESVANNFYMLRNKFYYYTEKYKEEDAMLDLHTILYYYLKTNDWRLRLCSCLAINGPSDGIIFTKDLEVKQALIDSVKETETNEIVKYAMSLGIK